MNSYLANIANAFFGDLINGQGLNVSFSNGKPPNYDIVTTGQYKGQYTDGSNSSPAAYDPITKIIYISPYITERGLNYIILEIGHELIHALIFQKYPNINDITQEYLAGVFQSKIWQALGDMQMSNAFLAAANSIKNDTQKYPDFNSVQADDFQKNSMPAAPQPPCK
jgi:hypothetical protein